MGSRKISDVMGGRILESIGVIVASVFVAFLARYSADHGYVPESFVLPIYAVIVFVGGYLVIRIITGVLYVVAQPTLGTTRTRGLRNFLQLIGAILLIIIAFAIFGYNLTGALVGAGFLGIVLGLGAQQVLGNVFAGLSLLVAKPFEIGDRVTLATSSYGLTGSSYSHENQVSGFTGVITDVGIFFTKITLENGTPAVLPNSVAISALVINNSKTVLRTVRTRIDLDKKTDFDQFRSRLVESLKGYEKLDSTDARVEISDVTSSTYQVSITARAGIEFEDAARTIVFREGMRIRDELART